MKKLLLILALTLTPAASQAACTMASGGVGLCYPNFNDPGSVWAASVRNNFVILNSSVPVATSSPTYTNLTLSGWEHVASSVTALAGFYGDVYGKASGNVLKAGDSMTGGLSINAVSSATTLSVLNQRTSATNTGANIQAVGSGATENIALWLEGNGATKNTAIFISSPAAGASNYAIHSQSLAQSKFFGTITAPAGFIGPLTGNADTATTATSVPQSGVNLSTVTTRLDAYASALSTAVYTTGAQSIAGAKTFSDPLTLNGSSLTVVSNALAISGAGSQIIAPGKIVTGYGALIGNINNGIASDGLYVSNAYNTADTYPLRIQSNVSTLAGMLAETGVDLLTVKGDGAVAIAGNAFSVGGSSFIVDSGRFGMGTAAPTALSATRLNILGHIQMSPFAGIAGYSAYIGMGNWTFGQGITANDGVFRIYDGALAKLTLNPAGSVDVNGNSFSVGGTSVTVAYGSLGVGASAAVLNAYAAKFYVENDISNDYAGIFNNPKAAGTSDGVKIIAGGDATDTAFVVQDRTETRNALSIDGLGAVAMALGNFTVGGSTLVVTGGKVGVNIAVPSAPLHIQANTPGGEGIRINGRNSAANEAGIEFYDPTGVATHYNGIFSYPTKLAILNSAWAEKVTFLDGGNVGIGVTAPTHTLQVNGSIGAVGIDASSVTVSGSGSAFTAATSTVTFAGYVDIGIQMAINECGAGVASCTATCAAGKYVIGGGCFNLNKRLRASFPLENGKWYCGLESPETDNMQAYAICARIVRDTTYDLP